MIFDGTQKTIGKGAQAEVVCYQGYAYKIYRPSYPSEWIAFEKKQQQAVNQAGLSGVRYYDTDDDHIVKMDLIDGVTLESRAQEGDSGIWEILADAFRFVHDKPVEGVDMPPFAVTAVMGLSEEEKKTVMPIIERLSAKMETRICHFDLHFLNVMIPNNGPDYIIIDWMNARLAPLVFDYARTYVIFEEFSKVALDIYVKRVLPQMWATGVSENDFYDAVKVCRVVRQQEKKEFAGRE